MSAWVAIALAVLSGVFGYVIANEKRMSRIEGRLQSLGQQLASLPKRKSDHIHE